MNIPEEFPARLQRLMQARKMSQSELARLMHTQPSTLTRWFAGSVPRRNTLNALAATLRVNPEWLASGRGSMTGDPLPSAEPPQSQLMEVTASGHTMPTLVTTRYVVGMIGRALDSNPPNLRLAKGLIDDAAKQIALLIAHQATSTDTTP